MIPPWWGTEQRESYVRSRFVVRAGRGRVRILERTRTRALELGAWGPDRCRPFVPGQRRPA